jgi:acetylornithine/N-succinyldiaminopimelate aminotransferase
MLAGIAVNVLGYRHPKLLELGEDALNDVHHLSNLFEIPSQKRLAEDLSRMTFGTRAFFCNSGAEAIEAAIKFSRKYSQRYGNDGRVILSAENSFHGRSLGALSATGQTKYQDGFEPLPDGFEYTSYNDVERLEESMHEEVCAVLVEPVQGEGGIVPADGDFIEAVREQCDRYDALMVVDEIQSGMGRTGNFLAVEQYGVQPDLVTLAKGLGGGFPIGVMLADDSLRAGLQSGDHASTFGGNPFVTKIARGVLDQIRQDELIERAGKLGKYLKSKLQNLASDFSDVMEPRGFGLMIGLPLGSSFDAGEIMEEALQENLILGTAGTNTLRFVPPLILTESNVDAAVERLARTLKRQAS